MDAHERRVTESLLKLLFSTVALQLAKHKQKALFFVRVLGTVLLAGGLCLCTFGAMAWHRDSLAGRSAADSVGFFLFAGGTVVLALAAGVLLMFAPVLAKAIEELEASSEEPDRCLKRGQSGPRSSPWSRPR